MKRLVPNLLAVSLAFLAGLAISGNLPYQIGRLHAYIDLARGHYELQTFGPLDRGLEEFNEIATERYGFEIVTHGCIISEAGIERMRGYNEVSEAAIRRKYGANVIEYIWDRALPEYRAKEKLR
jgi:hypothetical protein